MENNVEKIIEVEGFDFTAKELNEFDEGLLFVDSGNPLPMRVNMLCRRDIFYNGEPSKLNYKSS